MVSIHHTLAHGEHHAHTTKTDRFTRGFSCRCSTHATATMQPPASPHGVQLSSSTPLRRLTRFSSTTWHNAQMRIQWRRSHEGILQDIDGTFAQTGEASAVVPENRLLMDPRVFPTCRLDLRYGIPRDPAGVGAFRRGLVCRNLQLRRFTFGLPEKETAAKQPASFDGSPLILSLGTSFGSHAYGRFISA